MSLRAKILLAVALVNLGVTVLLALFFLADLDRRERALKQRERKQQQEARDALVRSFGGSLELEEPGTGRQNVAKILHQLLRHPVLGIIDDGIILNRYRSGPTGEVRPTDVYLNLMGAKDRGPEFDERHARRRIREAIETGETIAMSPPLIITEPQIDEIVSILGAAIDAVD